MEQGGLRAEQRCAQRLGAMAVGSVTADRGDQRRSALVDHRLRCLLGGQPGQRRHLGQRRPLQPGHGAVEAELGGGGAEPLMERPVMVGGDFTEIGPARHQIVGARPQPAGDDQPTHHPPVLERQRALGGQRQPGPPVGADPGEEHASDRRHRVAGEHAGRNEVGSIRGDEILDIGATRP